MSTTMSAGGLLLLTVGAPGAGKSTWAHRHFPPSAIISSDQLRFRVCGRHTDQAATPAAVRILHAIVQGRMQFGQTTVVDATNAEPRHRDELLEAAHQHGRPVVAVVFDVPLQICLDRNARRRGRRRVPESFVRATHARICAEFPAGLLHVPDGLAAVLWIDADGQARLRGQVPAEYRTRTWLTGAPV
ncbi:AAA family ATPase [Actinoplanes sp. G11-F43]|uniref:AAA family ATPase n=1 Tax=Actinoplanes sp. G11-F43 TaxID=3424130 RepID=UPI003D3259C8